MGTVSIALASVLTAAPYMRAQASSDILESFNGKSLNKAAWTKVKQGIGPSVRQKDGYLEFNLPGTSHSALTNGAFFAGIESRCSFTGNLDVRVTFRLIHWPATSGARAGLLIDPVGSSRKDGVHIERASWSPRDSAPAGSGMEVYASNFNGAVSYAPTVDVTGRLRLARRGNRVTSYTDQSGRWVAMHTGPGAMGKMLIGLRVWAHDRSFEHQDVQVAFDNLRIVKGQPTCARSLLPR